MAPRSSFRAAGAFFVVQRKERAMSELEDRHYLMNGGETLPDAREALD
jgi:hypothetical protein